MRKIVGIYRQDKMVYSNRPPFNPPESFVEYPFKDIRKAVGDRRNHVYKSIRELLRLLGFDSDGFGTGKWNPLGVIISPGDTVLMKPNMVRHCSESGRGGGLFTHGSIVRAFVDYAFIAMQGRGRIIIADGPMDDGDFNLICKKTGIYEIVEFYRKKAGFNIEVYDLRREMLIKKSGSVLRRVKLDGDPAGYTCIDLGKKSQFSEEGVDPARFKGAECIDDIMKAHHNDKRHEYLISNTFLNSDVVINLAKMKTHKKSGVTLCMKNNIGITGDRNWLPHFYSSAAERDGALRCQAHSYLRRTAGRIALFRRLKSLVKDMGGAAGEDINKGNWPGNDVIWRTIADLVFISMYADGKGRLQERPQRRILAVIDGIVAGEGDGPVDPVPKRCGLLIGGLHQLCVDIAATALMGFDFRKLAKFNRLFGDIKRHLLDFSIEEIACISNIHDWNTSPGGLQGKALNLRPARGWKEIVLNGRDKKR